MLYLVDATQNDVPFSQLGFLVDDAVIDGQYDNYGDDADTPEDAIDALSSYLGSAEWTKVPICFNDVTTQLMVEYFKPLLTGSLNGQPFNTVHNEGSSEPNTLTLNDKTLISSITWDGTGSGSIATGSPCAASANLYSDFWEIRLSLTYLPSDAITDGKFTLNTNQQYRLMSFSISRVSRLGVIRYHWHFGQYTYTGNIPEAWLVLNGSHADEGDNDPYSDDDDGSGTGGGEGDQDNWDEDSESNPIPGLPSLEATDAGFITLYMPTIAQLRSLASYMWSNLFDLNTFKKLFADPMDCILGMSIVPVDARGSASSVKIGNIDTGISMTKASHQYVSVNCGSLKITEKLHSYLDYSPYRKVHLYLPYIGTQDLDIDMLNGSTLGVVYHVDILSGACIAYVTIDGNVIEQYSGQCAMSIPVTSRDFTNTLQTICTLVSTAAPAIASGGMSAPVSAASIAGAVTAGANTANNVMNSKPSYSKAGNVGSSCGIMSIQKPFLIIERPRMCRPVNQNKYTGYPSYITRTLGNMSGFTQVQDIKLDDIPMTDTERDELLSLLREGIIL